MKGYEKIEITLTFSLRSAVLLIIWDVDIINYQLFSHSFRKMSIIWLKSDLYFSIHVVNYFNLSPYYTVHFLNLRRLLSPI